MSRRWGLVAALVAAVAFGGSARDLYGGLGSPSNRDPSKPPHSVTPDYSGPWRLGPFRIDRPTPLSRLVAILGAPARGHGDLICYAERGGKAFLWVDPLGYDHRMAKDILLAAFPNCVGTPVVSTEARLHAWKTTEGIGLGSTRAAVEHAYGTPTGVYSIASDNPAIVYNPKTMAVPGRRMDGPMLLYNAARGSQGAQFGLAHGRVAWVYLTGVD